MTTRSGNVTSQHYPEQEKKSHRLYWVLGLVVLLAVALVAWHLINSKPPAKGAPAQVVKVAKAAQGDMPVTLSELGTVTPVTTITVVPNQAVSGYLTEVPFQEGQDIAKDQLLAQIDPRPYEILKQQAEAQLAKDQAALEQAKSDLQRYAQLAKEKSIAVQTFVDQKFLVLQDEASVKLDQANVNQDELNISYCHITSPVAGRVGLRLVDQGNYITGSSNTGLAVITTVKPTTVEFTVAQNDLGSVVERVNSGAKLPVTAMSSDNSKTLGTGTLYALSNQMTTSTGTVTLRATFPNDDGGLFPNEFVNVNLLVNTLTGVTLIPTSAVLTGAPGTYVFLVTKGTGKEGGKGKSKEGKIDKSASSKDGDGHGRGGGADYMVTVRKVTIGATDGKNTVVTDGLNIGDMVVTEGMDRLTDNASVKIGETDQTDAATTSSPPQAQDSNNGGESSQGK